MNQSSSPGGGWKILRRVIICLAFFATLLMAFYTEENWRGRRAWEDCKRDLESRGFVMDWNKLLPSPVPDAQNFFKTSPELEHIFTHHYGGQSTAISSSTNTFTPRYIVPGSTAGTAFPVLDTAKTGPILVANITVASRENANSPSAPGSHLLKSSDPNIQSEADKLIRTTLGDTAVGCQNFTFSAIHLDQLTPVQIVVQTDSSLSISNLEQLLSANSVTNFGRLRIENVEGAANHFHLLLTNTKITAALDYLQWCDQYEPFLDDVREGLKRPYAQINWELSEPYMMPVPNFIITRLLVQMLAQRAQCYWLLGEPEKALDELTLLAHSRRILMQEPTGQPMTLVASMINVAVSGLYAATVTQGIRSDAWREPELIVLQAQLKNIDLPPLVANSFNVEMAASFSLLEDAPVKSPEGLFSKKAWERLYDPAWLVLNLGPRGWRYQNVKTAVVLQSKALVGIDLNRGLFLPGEIQKANREVESDMANWSPWKVWSTIMVANFMKANLTTARNQTAVNETQVACALERYHLAHGEYPETLDALVPQLIDQLPHDIIGGQPLHYHRTNDGKFLLYSIGWNEKDDGGVTDPQNNRENADWVW